MLEEAADPGNPLLERVKFLAITASNLDEFVEVRVAGLLQQAEQRRGDIGPDGQSPADLLPQPDTEKARILRPDGTYVRAHKAGLNHRRNGTRFSVQEFLMDLSEKSGDATAENGLSHFLKSKSSPAFEILSKKWHEPHSA